MQTTNNHTHVAIDTRRLPFGSVSLSTCRCGARSRSDAKPIPGGTLGMDGWYGVAVSDASREAYDLLQSEGHEAAAEASDSVDEFGRPGAQ